MKKGTKLSENPRGIFTDVSQKSNFFFLLFLLFLLISMETPNVEGSSVPAQDDEAAKLQEMQKQVDQDMSMSGIASGEFFILIFEEKKKAPCVSPHHLLFFFSSSLSFFVDIDMRSVFVGNVSPFIIILFDFFVFSEVFSFFFLFSFSFFFLIF